MRDSEGVRSLLVIRAQMFCPFMSHDPGANAVGAY